MTKKIIFDCDPGHDDALALMMAVASPKIDVLAVTTSAGNQTPDKTLNNAMRMLTLLHREDIPVAQGNQTPLVEPLETAPEVHGETGLDGADLPDPDFKVQPIPAIELIAKTLCESDEKVTLVVTGPMTNAALFLRVYPDLAKEKIDQIVFMGGAMGLGNWRPSVEFNIFVDPEAAKIVMNFGLPLVMAPLNVTHKAQIMKDEIEQIGQINNPVAQAFHGLLNFFEQYHENPSGAYLRIQKPFYINKSSGYCTSFVHQLLDFYIFSRYFSILSSDFVLYSSIKYAYVFVVIVVLECPKRLLIMYTSMP